MAKAKQRFQWLRNAIDGIAIKIDRLTKEEIRIEGHELPEEIQKEIFVYGISKIIDDRLSQISAGGKMAATIELVKQLTEGTWKAERTGGIHVLPLIIEAIMRKKKCDVAPAQAAYRLLDDEEKIALKEALKDLMSDVEEARKAAEEVTLDDLVS